MPVTRSYFLSWGSYGRRRNGLFCNCLRQRSAQGVVTGEHSNERSCMPVNFKDIEPEFTSRGLEVPTLAVLEPDTHLYDVLAIQPKGEIAMRAGFIGHASREGARHRF